MYIINTIKLIYAYIQWYTKIRITILYTHTLTELSTFLDLRPTQNMRPTYLKKKKHRQVPHFNALCVFVYQRVSQMYINFCFSFVILMYLCASRTCPKNITSQLHNSKSLTLHRKIHSKHDIASFKAFGHPRVFYAFRRIDQQWTHHPHMKSLGTCAQRWCIIDAVYWLLIHPMAFGCPCGS